MAIFRYEAVDRAGKVVMGAMDAASESVVTDRLAQMGYTPQRILPPAGMKAAASTPAQKTGQVAPPGADLTVGGARARDMAVYFRQFAVLTRSGISLFQALDNLASRTPHPGLARTSRAMADAARSGGRISDVMAQYPRLYPSHVIGSVRAGELGGFIPVMLEEIAQNYEDDVAFYKWVWIPKWLVIQAFAALVIGQPVFPALFPEPKWGPYARLLFFRNVPIALVVVLGVWLLYRWLNQPAQADRRDRLALRTPVFGDLARQRSLVSFVRTLGRLYHAGVGPTNAWEGAMNVVPNSIIRQRLVEAHATMQAGQVPLHEAFASTGLFANETEQLLATGVVSGEVVEMMDRVTAYYQDNVDRARRTSQFWMFRLGCLVTLVLSGALMLYLVYSYFHGIFNWVDDFFKSDLG